MTRGEAYRWLAEVMGLSEEEAHIARFSKEQCESLLKAVFRYRSSLGKE